MIALLSGAPTANGTAHEISVLKFLQKSFTTNLQVGESINLTVYSEMATAAD